MPILMYLLSLTLISGFGRIIQPVKRICYAADTIFDGCLIV